MRAWRPTVLVLLAVASTAQAAPISVGNFIWRDIDGDGVQDAGEPGLEGVTVQLWNGTKTLLIHSGVSNASGIYQLTAPGPGDHRVRVLLPTGADFSPKNQGGNDLTDSDVNPSGGDFGFTDVYTFGTSLISITSIDTGIVVPNPIRVGNFIWHDIDEDGLQETAEPGIASVTVQLWNAAKTQLIDSDVTTASGAYELTAPGAGDYRVRVVLPSVDAEFSPKNQGTSDLTDSDINPTGPDAGFTDPYTFAPALISITSIDGGLVIPTPVDVGDFVWDDLDKDGVQDTNEPGVPDIVVQLWNDARNQLLDQTVTDRAGAYVLIAPDAGNYRVRAVLGSTDYTFTTKDQGGNDTRDSDIHPTGLLLGFTDTVSLTAGVASTSSVDAGLAGPRLFANGFE